MPNKLLGGQFSRFYSCNMKREKHLHIYDTKRCFAHKPVYIYVSALLPKFSQVLYNATDSKTRCVYLSSRFNMTVEARLC